MTQSAQYPSSISPKHFVRTLVGLWLFFSIAFGFFSAWFFSSIMEDNMSGDGFMYTSIYSGFLIGIFGLTWYPLHKRFPLKGTRNIVIHIHAQIANSLLGFFLGFMTTNLVHAMMTPDPYAPAGKEAIAISVIIMMCIIGMLGTSGIMYVTEYVKRSMEAEQRIVESELSALRAQINPHFLFNSLNSIAALIRISPSEAESVTEDLADVFRYTLRASDRPLVVLKDELEIIRLYLNIEQARFKDCLDVEINVPENLNQVTLPVLTLQPLVENAVKHGISKKEGRHTITLEIERQAQTLQISVTDTGPGFPHNDFSKFMENGTGLSNIFKRLQLHFGDSVDAAINSNTLILRFPFTELGEHSHFEPTKKSDHESVSG
jgi:two-component sensor histidine kinase